MIAEFDSWVGKVAVDTTLPTTLAAFTSRLQEAQQERIAQLRSVHVADTDIDTNPTAELSTECSGSSSGSDEDDDGKDDDDSDNSASNSDADTTATQPIAARRNATRTSLQGYLHAIAVKYTLMATAPEAERNPSFMVELDLNDDKACSAYFDAQEKQTARNARYRSNRTRARTTSTPLLRVISSERRISQEQELLQRATDVAFKDDQRYSVAYIARTLGISRSQALYSSLNAVCIDDTHTYKNQLTGNFIRTILIPNLAQREIKIHPKK